MKKTISLALILALALTLCAGCGSSSPREGAMYNTATASAPYEAKDAGFAMGDYEYEYAYDAPMEEAAPAAPEATQTFTEKIIYSASATIQTRDFEGSLAKLEALLGENGAYLDASTVNGKSYSYYGSNLRSASFTIRVPVANFGSLTGSLEGIGNVLSLSRYNENITERYYDSQSRLDTYRVEEERVLEMLKKAETVSDMLELESRLSDIRYEIESLESRLRTWQKQVDYSTVTLYLQEVEELTVVPASQRTYLQRLGDSFAEGFAAAGRGLGEFFLDLVEALPTLVLLALAALILWRIVAFILKKRREKKLKKLQEMEKKE